MKKLFLVSVKDYGYDEYDSVIVIADSEQEAIEICKTDDYETAKDGFLPTNGYFVKAQGEITVKEINLNTDESKVILASYNAG